MLVLETIFYFILFLLSLPLLCFYGIICAFKGMREFIKELID